MVHLPPAAPSAAVIQATVEKFDEAIGAWVRTDDEEKEAKETLARIEEERKSIKEQ